MPSIAAAVLKPGSLASIPRQTTTDPSVQLLASFLVLLALVPLLSLLVGRPYDAKPDKWSASRSSRLRNPKQEAPSASARARFPAPISAVHHFLGRRAWTPSIVANAVGDPAIRPFSLAEAATLSIPSRDSLLFPSAVPHTSLAAAQRTPPHNDVLAGHSPTLHSRVFDRVQKDFAALSKPNSPTPPNPNHQPDNCVPVLHAAVRALCSHKNPDVFRSNLSCSAGKPKAPSSHVGKHHVIYLLYSSTASYVGYTSNASQRCQEHMSHILHRAARFDPDLPLPPPKIADPLLKDKYIQFALSPDSVRFVVLMELVPPCITPALSQAFIACGLASNPKSFNNWKSPTATRKLLESHVPPLHLTGTNVKDSPELRHLNSVISTSMKRAAAPLENFMITQLKTHAKVIYASTFISTKRKSTDPHGGTNDAASKSWGTTATSRGKRSRKRTLDKNRKIYNAPNLNWPTDPLLPHASLIFATFFPTVNIGSSSPKYTAFKETRFIPNPLGGAPIQISPPLDTYLLSLSITTLRKLKAALSWSTPNSYPPAPAPADPLRMAAPPPVAHASPISAAQIAPSNNAVLQLSTSCQYAIAAKTTGPPRAPPDYECNLTIDFVNPLQALLSPDDYHEAMTQACQALLLPMPPCARKPNIRKRAILQNAQRFIFNYNSLGSRTTPLPFLNGAPNLSCACHLYNDPSFKVNGHIATWNPAFLLSNPANKHPQIPSLVRKLLQGTKHRPPQKLTRQEEKRLLMKDLHRYSLSLIYAIDWTEEDWGDNYDAWLDQTADAILAKMDAKAVAQHPPQAQAAQDTLTAQESRLMTEVVHANFIASQLEKAANDSFFTCKTLYHQKVMEELGKPQYVPLGTMPPPPTTPGAPPPPPAQTNYLLPQPTPQNPCALPKAFLARIKSHIQKYPQLALYQRGTGKRSAARAQAYAHADNPPVDFKEPNPAPKPPDAPAFRLNGKPSHKRLPAAPGETENDRVWRKVLKFRPITAAGGKILAPIDKLVLAIELLLNPFRDALHERAYTAPDMPPPPRAPFSQAERASLKRHSSGRWILKNTAAATRLIDQFNNARKSTPYKHRVPPQVETWDFTSMYTNLPVNELIDMHLDELKEIKELLTQSNQGPNIEIKYDPDQNEWATNFTNAPPQNKKGKNGATPPLVISLATYHTELFTFILRNACLQYGGVMFQQVDGIPMGIACAVELAQNACARYELIFVRAAIAGRCWDLLAKIMSTGRYIDDIISLDGKWMEHCKSRNRPYTPVDDPNPIAGIYPPSLTLNLESSLYPKNNAVPSLDEVIFLDVSLVWDLILRCLAYSTHDKRSLPKYDFSRLLRFPLSSTCLWDTCFYGIVKSEMSRFATTCSSLDRFVVPAGNLIFELYCKGYDAAKLYKALSQFLKAKAPLFPSSFSYPIPTLNWMTTTAISYRVSFLWDNGMPTYNIRNRRLNLPEPSTLPLTPPPPYFPGSLPSQQQVLPWAPFAP